jgi:hypothetical protein
VLFSYKPFLNDEFNFGEKNKQMFLDFIKCLSNPVLLKDFKLLYKNLGNAELEGCADSVFSRCTSKLKCIHVAKSGYKLLNTCLKEGCTDKKYYNSACNRSCAEDIDFEKASNGMTYCQIHAGRQCKILNQFTDLNYNLKRLYSESVLSEPFMYLSGEND